MYSAKLTKENVCALDKCYTCNTSFVSQGLVANKITVLNINNFICDKCLEKMLQREEK